MILTVIIPTKNRLHDLEACLRSISGCTQTSVLVVDDHSEPPLKDVMTNEFAWVSVIDNEGSGVGMARNTGLNHAHTPYVMFVDSDDVLLEDWETTILSDIHTHEEAQVLAYPPTSLKEGEVGERHVYFRDLIHGYLENPSELTLAHLKFRAISVCSKIYKTSFLKSNMITFGKESIGEDVLFSTKVGLACEHFYVSDKVWYQISETLDSHNTQFSKSSWSIRLELVIAQAKLIKQNVEPALFKQLNFPVKHYLTRAVKANASWSDIIKYVYQARKLGIL